MATSEITPYIPNPGYLVVYTLLCYLKAALRFRSTIGLLQSSITSDELTETVALTYEVNFLISKFYPPLKTVLNLTVAKFKDSFEHLKPFFIGQFGQ